ncbi:TetR/AcrR family transcriptional regulator [Persicitalea sp.]|uniref:TetR/AcrR family transcriptional regulator n=1 Tax=Persicitalea sp. TaxID=3100273 RepID=UPI0035936A45
MKYTKSYLMDRALKLFNKDGLVNVRLQHIADYGGVSVGNLAYHFKNKECIVEALYDELKDAQEKLLYEFRMAHLFEEIDCQLRHIFQCQKQSLFFYLDTLEIMRAYPSIREKHRQHLRWQVQQIGWMLAYNADRNTFRLPDGSENFGQLAELLWLTMDNWMYARQIRGLDHLAEEDFVSDIWSLLTPYLTEEARAELSLLSANLFTRL